jgi:hypothetical protein
MGIFRRKVPHHFVPIHPANTLSKDWIIILEAGTIVGPAPSKLRVARATQERSIVKRHNIFLVAQHYLVVDGYDPRIHALYFCPQLYRYDSERKLIPLQGEEIGTLIAQSVERGVTDRRPWYGPTDRLPGERVISTPAPTEFDTVVVDMPGLRNSVKAEGKA